MNDLSNILKFFLKITFTTFFIASNMKKDADFNNLHPYRFPCQLHTFQDDTGRIFPHPMSAYDRAQDIFQRIPVRTC